MATPYKRLSMPQKIARRNKELKEANTKISELEELHAYQMGRADEMTERTNDKVGEIIVLEKSVEHLNKEIEKANDAFKHKTNQFNRLKEILHSRLAVLRPAVVNVYHEPPHPWEMKRRASDLDIKIVDSPEQPPEEEKLIMHMLELLSESSPEEMDEMMKSNGFGMSPVHRRY